MPDEDSHLADQTRSQAHCPWACAHGSDGTYLAMAPANGHAAIKDGRTPPAGADSMTLDSLMGSGDNRRASLAWPPASGGPCHARRAGSRRGGGFASTSAILGESW